MSIRPTMMPAVLAGLLAATPLMAQPAPSQAPTKATPATAAAPAPTPAHRDAMVERRIAQLHSQLKITPAEEKPFDDFAQAMRDNAQRMDQLVSEHQTMASTATAVDQMKSYNEMVQAHAEEVSHLIGPFSTLYDALTPDQKKMADESFRQFANGPRGGRANARS